MSETQKVLKRPRMTACRACGRPIWGKKSKRLGYGRTCYEKVSSHKLLEEQGQMRLFSDDPVELQKT